MLPLPALQDGVKAVQRHTLLRSLLSMQNLGLSSALPTLGSSKLQPPVARRSQGEAASIPECSVAKLSGLGGSSEKSG